MNLPFRDSSEQFTLLNLLILRLWRLASQVNYYRSFQVNAHTVDEVVHTAPDRVGCDAGDRAPMDSVGRSTEHDVISAAAAFVAAIRPGNVHRASAVNGRGRQPKVAQTTIRTTAGSAGNTYRRIPALAAIGGAEG